MGVDLSCCESTVDGYCTSGGSTFPTGPRQDFKIGTQADSLNKPTEEIEALERHRCAAL
jgi:hypothetical protein